MSITRFPPNTIWLGGEAVQVGDVAAGEAITPGHLIERYNDGGVAKFRKHATAGGDTAPIFALNQSMLNLGVDDDYAEGDLVEALVGQPGTTVWALIASGVNLAAGAQVESAGNGQVRAKASGKALGTVVETANNTAGPGTMRVKVEVL